VLCAERLQTVSYLESSKYDTVFILVSNITSMHVVSQNSKETSSSEVFGTCYFRFKRLVTVRDCYTDIPLLEFLVYFRCHTQTIV